MAPKSQKSQTKTLQKNKRKEEKVVSSYTKFWIGETIVVWIFYITALYITLARFIKKSMSLRGKLNSLTHGCSVCRGHPVDTSDELWNLGSAIIVETIPVFTVQAIIALILKKWFPQKLPYFYSILSLTWLYFRVGIPGLVIYIVPIFPVIAIYKSTKSKLILWILLAIGLLEGFLPRCLQFTKWAAGTDSEQYFLMYMIQSWLYCRLISYCVDKYENPQTEEHSSNINYIVDLFAYLFYLPYLPLGPMIRYSEFQKAMATPYSVWTWKKIALTLLNAIRYCLWFLVPDWFNHFAYHGSISQNYNIFKTFAPIEVIGFVLAFIHFHHMKYIFNFGVPGYFAELEQVPRQENIKCPAAISRCTTFFRCNDPGLYNFFKWYVYKPVAHYCRDYPSVLNQLISISAVYVTVILWHLPTTVIYIFVGVSFILTITDKVADAIVQNESYLEIESDMLGSDRNIRRFRALLRTLSLLVYYVCAAVFFLSNNYSIAVFTMRTVFFKIFPRGFFLLIFALYCQNIVAEDIQHWKLEFWRRQKKQEVKKSDEKED